MAQELENTNRKERQRQQAENRAQFMAQVTHELKTPLNAIIGFTSILLQDFKQGELEQERQLRLMYGSSQHLLERIDALIEFFRLEAGILGSEPSWFAPRELLLQATDLFQQKADEKKLEFSMEIGAVPTQIFSHSKLLLRILRELIGNAIQYTRQGKISLSLGINSTPLGETVQLTFSVKDSGVGINPKVLPKIVRSLDMNDREQPNFFDGLGLGLALSREIARILGGRIALSSDQLGGGTTVAFVLDLSKDRLRNPS